MFAGQVMTGASVSLIVMVKEQLALLPDGSLAVQVTVLVPFAKVEPEAGLQVTATEPLLSVAVALNVTLLRVHCPGSAASARFAGQLTTGAWSSL